MKALILISVLFGTIYCAELESRAKLLASKNVLNQFIVENRDLSVVYKIYNVGSSSAYNVELKDESFYVTDFEIVRGQPVAQWKSIPPSGNVTHALVLRPLKNGYFNFTAAQLTYEPTESGDQQMAFTTSPGEGGIMTELEFNRKHSPHLMEWSVFALLCMPSLVIPFLLWYRSYSKYSDNKTKKA